MTNRITEEFLALCNTKHILGAALTPRHQGLKERNNQVMMTDLLVLMESMCAIFPQEWPSLLPAVEYLLHTAPQGVHGISAHDMGCAYGIASESDRALVPYLLPKGLPETDHIAGMFARFRQLYSLFSRITRENALQYQRKANATRVIRSFEPGETVFRKLPRIARVSKHLFSSPCSGPYIVVSQPTTTSLILMDPTTQQMVDKGRSIPLDQIVAGPRRARLEFEAENEIRPYSDMLSPG